MSWIASWCDIAKELNIMFVKCFEDEKLHSRFLLLPEAKCAGVA